MQFLADILKKVSEYRAVEASVESSRLPLAVTGLLNIHKAHLIYSLCRNTDRKAIVLAPDEQEATKLCEDLETLFGGGVYFYPSRDYTLRPVESASREYEHERLKILGRMAANEYNAVVACADAVMQLTIPNGEYRKRTRKLKMGMELPLEGAVAALLNAGYVRAAQVDGRGQFAVRGGILDFYPPYADNPIRVEFWGDEPDSISYFDIETQRRLESAETALITPAVEVYFESIEQLKKAIQTFQSGLKTKSQKISALLQNDLEKINSGSAPAAIDRYLPICYQNPETMLNYAGEDGLLFVCEPSRVRERAKNTLWQHNEDLSVLFEDGILCKGLDRFYLEWPEICSILEKKHTLYLDAFARTTYDTPIRDFIHFNGRQLAAWSGSMKLLKEDLNSGLQNGGSVVVAAGTKKSCDNIVSNLVAEGFSAYAGDAQSEKCGLSPPGNVLVIPGHFSAGFEYPSVRFMLITYSGISGNSHKTRSEKRHRAGERIRNLSELSVGDYVVHSAHGIGVYEGIHKLEVQGIVKDYIKIRYAGKDTLYVPVTQLDLVSKYIGARDDGNIRLNKMGGTEWQKAKSRVKAAVKDIAKDLIALYAARKKIKGFAFPEDDDMQRNFEEHFEYEETDDQLRCAAEIKSDMEKSFPMDRLLCGDVGFGKTEVALRAAFKCVLGGKQCAILVPTTILAWQHYQTVIKRFEGFPISVELLSRFRSPKQQEEIIRKLGKGSVDIVIGTHRLVQNDVKFRDLGLVVVDEEQRFGVAQKEKLKDKFHAVDVLTLSATPIPRTLNMALSGIRDMSAIEEAPQDRHPVQTYVLEHDWGILTDAIKKELRRGGQVYYLHNVVESIEKTAGKIAELIPDARIGIAHGKMEEDELSRVWEKLLNNEIDILVCTTIIETGVDVPNCNTLIIEDADRMGLSQLHQIRGRVGRSNRRAFAYFTFKRGKVLSDIATKRLSAIREFTEFGAGFQIAMRDLEIRGAGNILGAQQHGHMESVGYDMYLKLLNDAIMEEKGKLPSEKAECMVDIQISAHIPETYIENSNQRLEIYRRIADIRDEQDVLDVIDELVDRFGDPPQVVKSLIDVALLRNTAAILGIKEISQRENIIMLYPERIDFEQVSVLVSKMKGRVMVNAGQKPYISVKLKINQSPVDAIRETVEALKLETAVGKRAQPK